MSATDAEPASKAALARMQLEELDLLDKHIAELSRQLGRGPAQPSGRRSAVVRDAGRAGGCRLASDGGTAVRRRRHSRPPSRRRLGSGSARDGKRAPGKSNRATGRRRGNRTMRRVLNQVAWSSGPGPRTASSGNCIIALIPRLGSTQSDLGHRATHRQSRCGKYCTTKSATSSGARWPWHPAAMKRRVDETRSSDAETEGIPSKSNPSRSLPQEGNFRCRCFRGWTSPVRIGLPLYYFQ